MNALGIETSSPVTSVALWRDGAAVAGEVSDSPRGHVEFLMPAIARLTPMAQIEAVAVGIGPGLFTSLRVGVVTAKTLALMLEVPLVGVCSLDALAQPHPGRVVACVDARRGEVFVASYADGVRQDEPRALPPGDVPEGLLVGNGHLAYPAELGSRAAVSGVPTADAVVALALPRLERGEVEDALGLEPLYVRRSDAEIKWETQGVTIERPMRVKFKGDS